MSTLSASELFQLRLDMLHYAYTYPTAPLPPPEDYAWPEYSFSQTPPLWYQDPENHVPPYYPTSVPEGVLSWAQYFTSKELAWPPQYPPTTPYPSTASIVEPDNEYDALCCIGYNPDTAEFEAIIEFRPMMSPSLGMCDHAWFESVGFWLELLDDNCGSINPPVFLGEQSVRVYEAAPGSGDCEVLHYSVKLECPPTTLQRIYADVKCNQATKLARLHCVLGANQTINGINYNGAGVTFGDVANATVQLHQSNRFGQWDILPTNSEVQATHAALLKNKRILYFAGTDMRIFDTEKNVVSRAASPELETPKPVSVFRFPNSAWAALTQGQKDDLTELMANYELIVGDSGNTNLELIDRFAFHSNLFCSGHTLLADGKLIIAGGTQTTAQHGYHGDVHHQLGTKTLMLYDPDNGKWELISPMLKHGRWYPSVIPMGDGSVFIMSGHPDDSELLLLEREGDFVYGINTLNSPARVQQDGKIDRRHENYDLEIYHPATKSIERILNGNISSGGYFPRIFVLPSGNIFCASGGSTKPNDTTPYKPYEDFDSGDVPYNDYKYTSQPPYQPLTPYNANIGTVRVYNREVDQGTYMFITETRKWSKLFEGVRHDEVAVLLPLRHDQEYEARVMTVSHVRDNNADVNAYITVPGSSNSWSQMSPNRPLTDQLRRDGQAIIMADGSVVIIGGGSEVVDSPPQLETDLSNSAAFIAAFNALPNDPNDTGKKMCGTLSFAFEPEIYNPFTNSWNVGEPMTYSRGYHSSYLLLPDGRIWVAGSERYIKTAKSETISGQQYNYNIYEVAYDQYGRRQMEIYSPDYLLRGPRPVYGISHTQFTFGEEVEIRLRHDSDVDWTHEHIQLDRLLLIRCATSTHGLSTDQRCITLQALRPTDANAGVYDYGEDEFMKPKTGQIPKAPTTPTETQYGYHPDQDKYRITFRIPSNPNIVIPGYYMLFILSKSGVPSKAEILHIQ